MSKSILGRTQLNIGTINLTGIVADTLEATSSIKGDYLTASKGLATNADNKIVSTTASSAEIDFLTGATSNIQTQLNAKEPTISLTANRALISNGSGGLAVSDITNTELGYLDGASSNIQTQITTNATAIATANAGVATNATAIATNATAISGKEPTVSLTANRALISSIIGKLAVSDITNTELSRLDGVSSNIQSQLNGKQPEIDSSNRLDVVLCGTGNVDNQSFVQLSGADLLSDTIKNILTTPSTKLIQAGTNLSYNTGTTPPTLNATDTNHWNLASNVITNNNTSDVVVATTFKNKINTNSTAQIGRGLFGYSGNSGQVGIQNIGLDVNGSNYAIQQNGSGKTMLNSSTGQRLDLCIDDSESLTISSTGLVGIGTNDPRSALHVKGTMNANSLGVHIGQQGNSSAIEIVSGDTDSAFIDFTKASADKRGRIIYNLGNDTMSIETNNAERMCIKNDGKVGINTTAPSDLLHVNGVCRATSFTTTSDDRVKHFETPTTDCLTKIMSLKPTTYQKSNELYDASFVLAEDKSNLKEGDELHLEVGFIAQEVKASIYEEFSSSVGGGDYMGYPVEEEPPEKVLIEQQYTLNYNNIFVVAVGAIQELKAEIESLKGRIVVLEQ